MRNRLLFVVSTIFLASCQPAPTTTELASKYKSNPDAFERLSRLIRADTGNKGCFVVGLDNIGDYWGHNGEWTPSNDYKAKLSLPEVLKAVGLTQDRYEEYKHLFASTGSERIRFCHAQKYVPQDYVKVLVYRSGLAVSGCSGTINWSKKHPTSTGKRGEGDFSEITELGNDWYLEYECT